MREIFIKYNPYKVETKITIDGKNIKKNSALHVQDKRLQEWIEDLPQILVEECNAKDFHIKFHGTLLDYEDLELVASEAKVNGINIMCEHIPAKEVKDKEQQIALIFEEIKAGPFDELRKPDLIKAFEMASTSDFEVSVVATMSAGKSTLINALLRQKLMPSKHEACTATITEIKDNDADSFRAFVFNENDKLIRTLPELTYEYMTELNESDEVSKIKVEGNIPFVSSDDTTLILVDTPGPNNSRNQNHRRATYDMLSKSSKTLVLYVMNGTQLAVNDDENLLSKVAESMEIGGKQSKDRFMFVINKVDNFKKGEDSVENTIKKVKAYLEDKGIKNPNIYPASALTALDIRTTLKDIKIRGLTDDDYDNLDSDVLSTIANVRKINNNPDLHLEKYSPLTQSSKKVITDILDNAEKEFKDKDVLVASEGMKKTALVHSGVISIEAAISTYVNKYAKTAKIKNIVDTFEKSLESARSFENTKQEIATHQEKQKEILSQIEDIEERLDSAEEAMKFKTQINKIDYSAETKKIADKIIGKAQSIISTILEKYSEYTKLTLKDAENYYIELELVADDLQAKVQTELKEVVNDNIQKSSKDLLNEYRNKISDLDQGVAIESISIKPLEILDGSIADVANITSILDNLKETEKVKVGNEWVKNYRKKWYKPLTWFQESGHFIDIYEDQEYISGKKLSERFFAPVQAQLYKYVDTATKYASEQTNFVKIQFNKKFDELDIVLKEKLKELKSYATDKKNAEKMIRESTNKLNWLQDIQNKLHKILEI